MNLFIRLHRIRWGAFVLGAVISLCAANGRGATLTDFGYRAAPPPNPHKTLVVMANFLNNGGFVNLNAAYWQSFIFQQTVTNFSVASYFTENSLGTFQLENTGIIRADLSPTNRLNDIRTRLQAADQSTSLLDQIFSSNIVWNAMEQVDFASYDANRDGKVDESELLLILISNEFGNGGVRGAGRVDHADSRAYWQGRVAHLEDVAPATTFVHEIGHIWNAPDLYGIFGGGEQDMNMNLTLMSGGMVHLDAWHKAWFGWATPRIRQFFFTGGATSGSVTLTAPQLSQPNAAVILHDATTRGFNEFFVLEYRTPQSSTNNQYEAGLPGSGLVIWHVALDANKRLRQHVDLAHPTAESDWVECVNCRCLVSLSMIDKPCPSPVETHTASNNSRRVAKNDNTAVGQGNWRQCSKCGGMSYRPTQPQSVCPAGGQHDGAASGEYTLPMNVNDLVGDNNWRRCFKCEILYHHDRQMNSVCPFDNLIHEPAPDTYTLIANWAHRTMMSRGAPYGRHGDNNVWTSGMMTPPLTWYSGESTHYRIRVLPFQQGADSITVEWFPVSDLWVDFRFHGSPEVGTFNFPYNSVTEAQNATTFSIPTVFIKTGQKAEYPRLFKPSHYRPCNGPVTIGR